MDVGSVINDDGSCFLAETQVKPKIMRNVIICIFLLGGFAESSFASLPDTPVKEMFDRSDLVFVGKLIRVENEGTNGISALIENVYTIKGVYDREIRLCNDSSIEKLGVRVISKDIQVYFLEKKNSCYFGAFGYKSVVYVKKNTNCIFSEFVYSGSENIGALEPLELFVKKLLGKDNIPDFPGVLKTKNCKSDIE